MAGSRSGQTGNPWKILESLTSSQWSKGKGNLWSGLNQWVPDGFHKEKQRQASEEHKKELQQELEAAEGKITETANALKKEGEENQVKI